LVVLLDLAQLFELVHDLLEMAAALACGPAAEEGGEGLENSEGPSWGQRYFRFSLEEKMAVWWSMKSTYFTFSSLVHLPSTAPPRSRSYTFTAPLPDLLSPACPEC
jgi:hypothetical protein